MATDGDHVWLLQGLLELKIIPDCSNISWPNNHDWTCSVGENILQQMAELAHWSYQTQQPLLFVGVFELVFRRRSLPFSGYKVYLVAFNLFTVLTRNFSKSTNLSISKRLPRHQGLVCSVTDTFTIVVAYLPFFTDSSKVAFLLLFCARKSLWKRISRANKCNQVCVLTVLATRYVHLR